MPADEGRVAVDATRAAADELRAAALPVAFEHGDASHPNLFRRADGSIAAVDWELADPDGLPAHDLTTFLAYVAVARARARTAAEQGRAIAEALTDEHGWAAIAGRDHLTRIGVEPALRRALITVALARMSMGLVERLHDDPAAALSPEAASWVRGHRYHVAWQAVAGAAATAGSGR
jgi:hypothetical protein